MCIRDRLIYLATLANFYFQPVGEGIYNRGTYTVQTTGYLVSPPPNLPPACRIVNTTSTAGIPAL